MRSVSRSTTVLSSGVLSPASRSWHVNGAPKATVTRERNAGVSSKFKPTATRATRMPLASLASAIRAAPVFNSSSRPVECDRPSGNRQTTSPAPSAASTDWNVSRILRNVGAVIHPAVDGNGARGAEEPADDWHLEERRLREKPEIPSRSRPDNGGVQERVGMIPDEQHGSRRNRRTRSFDAVEDPHDRAGEPPNRRVALRWPRTQRNAQRRALSLLLCDLCVNRSRDLGFLRFSLANRLRRRARRVRRRRRRRVTESPLPRQKRR